MQERIALAVTENTAIDNSNTGTKNTKASVIAELQAEGFLEPNEVTALQTADTIVIGDRTIDFSPLVEIVQQTLADADPKVYYGQPIDYDVDLNLDLDGRAQYDWQIFYKDKNNIYIIAEDYVPIDHTLMPTTMGNNVSQKSSYPYSLYWDYNSGNIQNGKTNSDDIFGNSAPEITKYIANKYLLDWKSKVTTPNTASAKSNARMTASLMDTSLWTGFATSTKVSGLTSKSSELASIGGPTLEMWVKSWNQKYGATTELDYANKDDGTGYYVGIKGENAPTSTYIDISSSTGYSDGDILYFPHKEGVSDCYGYWLASPSAGSDDYVMIVDYCGRVNYDTFSNGTFGVRPVVCLPSDITATWNETDSVWNIIKKQ